MMDIQHQRVVELCNELRLGGVAARYTARAQRAAEKRISFTDFVEELLTAERESRRASRSWNWPASPSSSALRTWCSLAPRAWAKPIWRSRSSREQANLFFQVVAQRYERGSMILTSNLTFGSWDSAFRRRWCAHRGDARSCPAPLIIVNINGESFRLKDKRKAGLLSKMGKQHPVRVSD